MRAVIFTKYGKPDVLQLQEIPKPIPRNNDVIINIKAATVTAGDCEIRGFKIPFLFWIPIRLFMGVFKPRIKVLGQEYSGIVTEIGANVTKFKVGDEVFGPTDPNFGAYAEFIRLNQDHAIALKPINIDFLQAASLPTGGINALYFLRKANLKPGKTILINGAGGSIGTIAIQLAKIWGAKVTAVDSEEKLEMLRELGADHLIDYKKEKFYENGKKYDVIFDVIGKTSFTKTVRSLQKDGVLLIANPRLNLMIRGFLVSKFSSKKVIASVANESKEALNYLKELVEKGRLKTVIDKQFSLEKIVEAHEYVEQGHKKGNVVIDI